MRKSNVTVTMVMSLEKEPPLIEKIVPILVKMKEEGEIEKAHISSKEIEVPYDLDI